MSLNHNNGYCVRCGFNQELHLNGSLVEKWQTQGRPDLIPHRLVLGNGNGRSVLFERNNKADNNNLAYQPNPVPLAGLSRVPDPNPGEGLTLKWIVQASYVNNDGSLYSNAGLRVSQGDNIIGYSRFSINRYDPDAPAIPSISFPYRVNDLIKVGPHVFLVGDEFIGRVKDDGSGFTHIPTSIQLEFISRSETGDLFAFGNNPTSKTLVYANLNTLFQSHPRNVTITERRFLDHTDFIFHGLSPIRGGHLVYGSQNGNALLEKLDNQQVVDPLFGQNVEGAVCSIFCVTNCNCQQQDQNSEVNQNCEGTCNQAPDVSMSNEGGDQSAKGGLLGVAEISGGSVALVVGSFAAGFILACVGPMLCKKAKGAAKTGVKAAICGPFSVCIK